MTVKKTISVESLSHETFIDKINVTSVFLVLFLNNIRYYKKNCL